MSNAFYSICEFCKKPTLQEDLSFEREGFEVCNPCKTIQNKQDEKEYDELFFNKDGSPRS